jgi:uncharacterized glyoxalase superfamily protein PhnB
MNERSIPAGYTALTPFLVVAPAARAIDWYVDVFGATVTYRLDGPVGEHGLPIVGQAELDFGTGRLQLSDPMPAFGLSASSPEAPTTGSIVLYVAEVDAVVARAEAGGAVIREAPADFVSGDRYASIVDPFGQRWAVMTRVQDLEEAESIRRVHEWWAGIAPSLTGSGE